MLSKTSPLVLLALLSALLSLATAATPGEARSQPPPERSEKTLAEPGEPAPSKLLLEAPQRVHAGARALVQARLVTPEKTGRRPTHYELTCQPASLCEGTPRSETGDFELTFPHAGRATLRVRAMQRWRRLGEASARVQVRPPEPAGPTSPASIPTPPRAEDASPREVSASHPGPAPRALSESTLRIGLVAAGTGLLLLAIWLGIRRSARDRTRDSHRRAHLSTHHRQRRVVTRCRRLSIQYTIEVRTLPDPGRQTLALPEAGVAWRTEPGALPDSRSTHTSTPGAEETQP